MTLRNYPVLILIALAVPLTAQNTASVTGKVTDDAGSGIPDLKVSVINQATKVEREVRTTADGAFALSGAAGTYAVAIEKPGRGVFAIRDIELSAGTTRTVNFEMSAKADNRNFLYMFYGFLAAWLVLVIYVITLAARERGLRKQIEDLKQMVESER